MNFVPFMLTARIAIVVAITVPAMPSRADGNLPPVFVGQEETILVPVPECSRCLVSAPERHPNDHRLLAACMCPD